VSRYVRGRFDEAPKALVDAAADELERLVSASA
jgi:hypothetical protein